MLLYPNPEFLSYNTYGSITVVMLGYRDKSGSTRFPQVELSQHQAAVLALNASNMVSKGDADVALFSSGWTIYSRVEIPDVEALWTP